MEGVWIGLARFTCTADRAAGRWERRPAERGPSWAGERGQRWTTGSVTHGDPSQTGIELDTGREGGPHDSSKSAGCNDGSDAPRAERWIPAEPDTLHHNPASECELLHQSLTDINPDFQTDAWAKQPGTGLPCELHSYPPPLSVGWDGDLQRTKRAVLKRACVLLHRFRCACTGCYEPRNRQEGEDVGAMLPGQVVGVGRAVRAGALLVLHFPRLQTPWR